MSMTIRAIGALLPTLLCGCAAWGPAIDSIGKWTAEPLLASKEDKLAILSIINADIPEIDTKEFIEARLEHAILMVSTDRYIAIRNDILVELRRRSNVSCHQYKQDLVRRQARGNFSLGSTALLMGTAGAITTSVTAARNFAGGAAVATGIRSEINQSFYYNQTVPVLVKAIDTQQKIQWGTIAVKRSVSKDEYSIREALVDIDQYHQTCSLMGALSALERAVDSINVTQGISAAVQTTKELREMRKNFEFPPVKKDSSLPAEPSPAEGAASTPKTAL